MVFRPNNPAGHISWRELVSTYHQGRLDRVTQWFDLAPFVDIVFTLILFFMLTSPFVTQWGIKVNLPVAQNITTLKPTEVEIVITPDDRIFIGGREFTLEELCEELSYFAASDQPVSIMSDHKASWGKTLEVWDAAKGAGVRRLNVRARVKTTK